MVSKLTLLGFSLLAWGAVAALASFPLTTTKLEIPLAAVGLAAATGGLVLAIIGAARHEDY